MLTIGLVIILCLLESNNGLESKVENQLLSNDSTIDYSSITKLQISLIPASRYQHELTRRSSNKKTISKPKNVKKTGVPLPKKQVTVAPFNKSRNSGASSSRTPKSTIPMVVPFETHDNYPFEVKLIHQEYSLAEPYSLSEDDPTLVCCLLDYVVKVLVDEKKKLNQPNGIYLYYDIHTITRLLNTEKKQELNKEDASFITQNGCWKGKEIIMPIYRGEDKHVVVLLAKTEEKLLHYFDPVDADMNNKNTKKKANEMLEKFRNLFEKRNNKVGPNDKIASNGWKTKWAYGHVPPKPKQNDENKDVAIHAIHYMDAFINNYTLLASEIGAPIDQYFYDVKDEIECKIRYNKWKTEQKELEEKQEYARKWAKKYKN